MMFRVLTSILLFSIIKSSYPLENNTKPNIRVMLSFGKVFVDLDDSHGMRVVKSIWDEHELSSVMCRQLGFGPPITEPEQGYMYDPEFSFDSLVGADAFTCTGFESELSECHLSKYLVSQSKITYRLYDYFMALQCLPSEAEEYSVALKRGNIHEESVGIPLIFFEGQWGPLCSYGKSSTELYYINNVLCNQLGFNGAVEDQKYEDVVFEHTLSLFVRCTGEERTIQECQLSPNIYTQNCDTITRISCGPYLVTTESPDVGRNEPIGAPFLVLIIIAGSFAFFSLLISCWKFLNEVEVPQSRLRFHNSRAVESSVPRHRQRPTTIAPNRSQFITEVPPQHPIASPGPTKGSDLPTYQEAVQATTELTNVKVL